MIGIRHFALMAVFALALAGGSLALQPRATYAMQFHCHNLNRIDYWVMTGIDTPSGGVFCHGEI
jgi:hypothetical protein